MKVTTTTTTTDDEFAEKEFIKKLKEQQQQQKDKQPETEQNRKALHKCLLKILNKNYRSLNESPQVKHNDNDDDEYLAAGIYDKFGNSCTEALREAPTAKCEAEVEDLSANCWYQSGLLGKFSLEMLKHQSSGSFVIHKGSFKSKNFILSLRVPSSKSAKVKHFLVLQSRKGYRLKGATKFFPTIAALVTHHSVMAEQLPVTLAVQRISSQAKNDDDFGSVDELKVNFSDLEDV